MVGKMIKVDRSTSICDKGGFARICVEMDLQQPLLPSYMVFGEERPIIYEGLHQSTLEGDIGGNDVGGTREKTETGSGATIITGDESADTCPFGKIKILRRDFRGAPYTAGSKKGVNENLILKIDQQKSGDMTESRWLDIQKEKKPRNLANKGELSTEKGVHKAEWVQVGSKRKTTSKEKIKGKESKAKAREKSHVGPTVKDFQQNSFNVLQTLESNQHLTKEDTHAEGVAFSFVVSDTNVELPNAPSPGLLPAMVVGSVTDTQCQATSTHQEGEDECMVEPDKTEGEAHQSTTVSQ
ncbi:hypothetical protein K1719_034568 [Acacia pycnantha]|nr:hypothetical protein K1719_034568 [Acacia pycnantha]